MKRILLYFGSFNPIHKGHVALAEYAVAQGLCDEVVLIVSPQNPLKPAAEQLPELNRFEMAELACEASKYPDQIAPSIIESLLPTPSYTIDTLRYLTDSYGSKMSFSILMGGDLITQLSQWKEPQEILDNYPIYVYPRPGFPPPQPHVHLTYLTTAPQYDYSSSLVRQTLERGGDASTMLPAGVLQYIQQHNLWSPATRLAWLSTQIESTATPTQELLLERGKLHYQCNQWGEALNDFNRILRATPQHQEAQQFAQLIQEILEFRYKDIYNP